MCSGSLVLTVPEAAAELRLAVKTIYRMTRSGELPSVKIGGAVRIPRADLEALLKGKQPAVTPHPLMPHRRRRAVPSSMRSY